MDRTNRIVVHIALAVIAGTVLFAALAIPLTLHALTVAHFRSAGDYGVADRFDGGMMGRGWEPGAGCGVQEYQPRNGGCPVQEQAPRNGGCPGYDDAGYGY